MIYYIDAFPERFHHPKEDEYLFYFLRIRHPDAIPLLDRLQGEHRAGAKGSGRSSRRWRATSRAARRVSGLPGGGRGLRAIPLAAYESRGGRAAARGSTWPPMIGMPSMRHFPATPIQCWASTSAPASRPCSVALSAGSAADRRRPGAATNLILRGMRCQARRRAGCRPRRSLRPGIILAPSPRPPARRGRGSQLTSPCRLSRARHPS